jgi:hypothetical protein
MYRLPFIVCLPRTTNVRFLFPFAAKKRKFAVSIFRFQKTNGGSRCPLIPFSVCGLRKRGGMDKETRRRGDMETWRHGYGDTKRKMEAQAIFLNPLNRLLIVQT